MLGLSGLVGRIVCRQCSPASHGRLYYHAGPCMHMHTHVVPRRGIWRTAQRGGMSSRAQSTMNRAATKERSTVFGALLWAFPVVSFSLGVWQIQRYEWKQNLKKEIADRIARPGVPFPADADLNTMTYVKYHIEGEYIDGAPMFRLGLRPLRDPPWLHQYGSGVSESGWQIISPFRLIDGRIVLICRGWTPLKVGKVPYTAPPPPKGLQKLDVLVRKNEHPSMVGENNPDINEWVWLDTETMARTVVQGRELSEQEKAFSVGPVVPILLDRCRDNDEYPIGGQIRIELSDNHLSYILTWFSISLIGVFLLWNRNRRSLKRGRLGSVLR